MPNPYAGSFTDYNGKHVTEGDRVRSDFGYQGTIVEILQDGDGTIQLDDGSCKQVKWCRLTKV